MSAWDFMGHGARKEAVRLGIVEGCDVATLAGRYGVHERAITQYLPAGSFNGRTSDFDSEDVGSTPTPVAIPAPVVVTVDPAPAVVAQLLAKPPKQRRQPIKDDFVEAINRHRGRTREPVSLLEALKHLGCQKLIVSSLDGAMLWKRLQIETGERITIDIQAGTFFGFRCEDIVVMWVGRDVGIPATEVVGDD